MNKTILTTLLATALVFTATAHAQILVTNDITPANSLSNAYFADPNYSGGGLNFTIAGNDFTTAINGVANQITFNGAYFLNPVTPPTDNFTISLYSVVASGPTAGEPLTLLASSAATLTRVDTGLEILGAAELYQYSGTLTSPFTLTSGVNYYLGISNADSPVEGFAVAHSDTGTFDTLWNYETTEGWINPGGSQAAAFELSEVDAAPEPSTFALLALPLLALFLRRKTIAS